MTAQAMKIGVSGRDVASDRGIWRRLPVETRWALVASGMVTICPDTGAPQLAEVDAATVQRLNRLATPRGDRC